ncbi:MAG: phage tail protein I [Cyanobacteria bacterium P01_E01_bin.42]
MANFNDTPQPDYRLIQPSLRSDDRTRWLFDLINRIAQIKVENALVYDIDAVTPTAIPDLLEQFSCEEFIIEGMTESQKRQLIWDSVSIHRHKGTRWAINHALSIVGATAEINEWWQGQSRRQTHTFQIAFDADANDQALLSQPDWWPKMVQIVEAAKPARSGFNMAVLGKASVGIGVGAIAAVAAVLDLGIPAKLPTEAEGGVVVGAIASVAAILELPEARLETEAEGRVVVGAIVSVAAILEL